MVHASRGFFHSPEGVRTALDSAWSITRHCPIRRSKTETARDPDTRLLRPNGPNRPTTAWGGQALRTAGGGYRAALEAGRQRGPQELLAALASLSMAPISVSTAKVLPRSERWKPGHAASPPSDGRYARTA